MNSTRTPPINFFSSIKKNVAKYNTVHCAYTNGQAETKIIQVFLNRGIYKPTLAINYKYLLVFYHIYTSLYLLKGTLSKREIRNTIRTLPLNQHTTTTINTYYEVPSSRKKEN